MDLEENYVEAIEEGKIVKVTKAHALREGLVILKKPELKINKPGETPSYYNKPLDKFNVHSEKKDYRKTFTAITDRKVGWQEQQVLNELVENFHWKIRGERRRKNYTRRQLANKIGESDENLQILESGRLPTNDFVLINKVQQTLGINLRKDGKDFTKSPREIMESTVPAAPKPSQRGEITSDKITLTNEDLVSSGIEILEDEI
jgi:ribosome-binding protein aMBF1 (putative translation factor)